MAIKKSTKSAKEANKVMSLTELRVELTKTQNDLVDTKRGHRLGELTNPRAITVTRKKIARLLTAIRAAEIANSSSNEKGDK